MPPSTPVSIVTPSLNQAPYLPACLASVRDQAWPDLEHLVIDGGSTDGSVEVLRAAPGITWSSGPDRGQAAAVNRGLALARGEVIGWLNSDDYYLPGAVAAAVACLDAHPGADAVYGRARMVDEAGRTLRPYPTFAFSRADLRRKCYVCQPAVFVRRRVLEMIGPLSEALHVCLDYDWWLRLTRDGTMRFCDRELAASRVHPATKTRSRRLRALVEAGYLMREHFGRASWRWSAKWVVHRWQLDRRRFLAPVPGWCAAARSAARYRQRFDGRRPPSAYGRRLLAAIGGRVTPPAP